MFANGMRFSRLKRLVRRDTWAAVNLANLPIDYIFLPLLMKASGSQRFCCGHFNVVLSNLGDNSAEQWFKLQKAVVTFCIGIMAHPEIDPGLKVLLRRIRTINVVRGRPRRSVMSYRAFLYLGSPSDEAEECVRSFLWDIIWLSKRRDEYFRNFRSAQQSFDMATSYAQSFMHTHCALIEHEVDAVSASRSDGVMERAV